MRVVLDTNVWLDWLVFGDREVEPLKREHQQGRLEIVINADCAAELERVLGYDMGRWTLADHARASCVDAFRLLCIPFERKESTGCTLPSCADPDDQKFLELAAAAHADVLVTKDLELLRLVRHGLPFRIVKPSEVLA